MAVTYEMTSDCHKPAIIYKNNAATPVWIQQLWQAGEFAQYIQWNGCGHCCAAMSANLHGISVTPYEEYMHCRELWGAPVAPQANFLSATGIQAVLNSWNIPAEVYGVKAGEGQKAAAHIEEMLRQDKMVIFASEPSNRLPNNIFSTGLHWVLCVGFDKEGNILVANSSNKITDRGVQLTDAATVGAAICENCDPKDMTWGDVNRLYTGMGYVVIG